MRGLLLKAKRGGKYTKLLLPFSKEVYLKRKFPNCSSSKIPSKSFLSEGLLLDFLLPGLVEGHNWIASMEALTS